MKKIFLTTIMVLGFAAANAQTKDEINTVGVWISSSGGFSNMGLAGKLDANIRYKSLFLGVMTDGSGNLTSDPESCREKGIQLGLIHKAGSLVFSFSGGMSQLNGVKRGQEKDVEFFWSSYKSYDMIHYSTNAFVLEERVMYQRNENSAVVYGFTITQNINPVNAYSAVMFNTSLVIF